jgi:hypothetical protein
MQYLLLVHEPVGQRAQRSRAEGEAVYARMVAFARDLEDRGILRGVESLSSRDSAAKVSVQQGKPRLVDGPFAEAKEMVGGFFLVDCATREEAIAIAAQCPAAEWATIEVRAAAPCYT